MRCTLNDIRNKEIINIRTGEKMGYADDIEFDTESMAVKSLIVCGRYRFFGLFGREDDLIVRCKDIEMIGADTILISPDGQETSKKSAVKAKILYK